MSMNFSREVILILSCVVLSLMMFNNILFSEEITNLRPPLQRPLARKHSLTRNSSTNGTIQHLAQATGCHVIHRYLNSCSSLPNYFLHGNDNLRHEYRHSIINFWHVQKTGGTTLEHCLIEMYNDRNYDTFHINISSCENQEKLMEQREYFQKAVQPLIRGHSSLGFCGFVQEHIASNKKCSNFVMFREPFERLVSFYYYSREAVKLHIKDPERLRRYLETNITEWVKNKGSSYWMGFTQGRVLYKKDNSTGTCGRPSSIAQKWPTIDAFSDSIMNNLDKYFSVVGLTEDFTGSLALFQRVYGLPFVASCSNVSLLEGTYENRSSTEIRHLKERAKRELMKDEEIRHLMKFDVIIYEKAKELFYKQKDQMKKRENPG